MDKTHISIIGMHISLVGGILMIYTQLSAVEENDIPFLMVIGGLFFSLLTLLRYFISSADTRT